MSKVLIKDWALAHNKTELLEHIRCAVPGYQNIDLLVDNIYFDEKMLEVYLSVEPCESKHASHQIGDHVLFHGGHIALLVDVAACALAFTLCDDRHIPVTRDMDVKYTGAGLIGAGAVQVKCHIENDDGRDIIVSAKCSQVGRSLSEGLVTISRTQTRILKRLFRELVAHTT